MTDGKIIYLDHAATTPVRREVLEAMMPYFSEEYGNPATLYSLGLSAKEAVDAAREQVAKLIGADASEIYFTSGGTESDNWAIRGTVEAFRDKGKHIITSAIEHHAVLETCNALEKEGFEITEIPVDSEGLVAPEDVRKAIRPDTILITIMHANNEVGTIEPIEEIGKIALENKVQFHTDAVQSAGKIPVDVKKLGCGLLSMSAHKLHGPKGIGALYIRKGTRLNKFMQGGEQESHRRAGTTNVPGVVGFGKACELARVELANTVKRETYLREKLIKGIEENIVDTLLNGPRGEKRLPNNVHFCFKGIEGEGIILRLNFAGICAATGSACTSATLAPSHVLLAMGRPHEIAHGSLRLTFGHDTTEADIDYVLEKLPGVIGTLRAMSPIYGKEKGL